MSGDNRSERRSQNAATPPILIAAKHRQAGRLDKAEALCRKLLQKTPNDVNALHLLGLIALDRGYPERAIQLIGQVLTRVPNFAAAHNSLGDAYRAARRLDEARASYRRAIELRPNLATAHNNLGMILFEQGEFAAALESCQRTVELEPRNADVLTNLANVLRALRRLKAAEVALRGAVQLRPQSADFHVNLGNLLIDLKRPDEAALCYQGALKLKPDLARAHCGLGIAHSRAGDPEAALDCYRAAIALNPEEAPIWNELGRDLRALGRFGEAAQAFRQAFAIAPDFADAYRNLISCQRLDANDAARLTVLSRNQQLPSEVRAMADFALGKFFDDADRFDEAFDAYARANATYRKERAASDEFFDAEATRRRVDESIASFTPAFFASVSTWGNPSELPVFIVGMPRSGTSLVEQIAASHSQVLGAGERTDMGVLSSRLGDDAVDWTADEVRRLADEHLERLKAMGHGAKRVIDKLPDNVFKLGVIATLFPSARIIFCHRDARDTALSCFFQQFSTGQLMFSYDLGDCGVRIMQTARLIDHWRHVLPLRMLTVSYETLVADLEGESRRLLAFLGVEWEPACLDFHLTQRVVTTSSGWQVRQPLYTGSVGRWRHYERHLGSLFAALGLNLTGEAELRS